MPKFFVTSKDQNGKTQSSVMEASDKSSAIALVQSQSLFVIEIQPIGEAQQSSASSEKSSAVQHKFGHNKVKLEDIVVFARQLATMLESGVPLLRSLSVIVDQVDSRQLSVILHSIRTDVEQGQPFSKSLGLHPRVFSPFWVSLVEVGEASGTMPRVLKKLTEYMEASAKFQSQLGSAMIYPYVLMGIGGGAVLCFALFIGPTFEKIFKDLHATLPGITVMMLAIFKFIQTQFILIVLAVIGLVFLFKSYVKTPVGRWQWEMLLFNVPTLGRIVRLIVVEKFTSQMAILIESGVPILYALEISERLVDNMVCGAILKDVRDEVAEGKMLADAMEKSGFFPSMAVQMIRVGEETGELSKMMGHVAVFYKGQVEEFMKNISQLIEPVMLVFMGGIIGLIVVAMFLPLLELSTGG